jgi:hypothetical protein
MIGNFYLMHLPIVLCALGAAVIIVPERRGRRIAQVRLLLPGLLAALGALLLIFYPDISQLFRPQLWLIVLFAVLAGAARGWLLPKDADHAWKLVKVGRAGDGLWAAIFLVVMAAVEVAAELLSLLTPVDDHFFLPTMELLTIVPAGYLLGRAVFLWFSAWRSVHVDLRDDTPPPSAQAR